MPAPLVTIIVPCYNAAPWLAATLESALAQTWPSTEIILIDDGSKDASLAIAQSFAARGVKVVAQANRGASAARNHGLRLARGEFIQFLDADDLLTPEKVAAQMTRLATSPGCFLASGAWARFSTSTAEANFTPHVNWRDLTGVEFLQLHYEQIVMMQPGAWLTPRTLLERVGPWDESLTLNDDGEYFARVMLAADGILFCPDARSYYRSGLPGSLSRRTDRRSLESYFRSVELTLQHLAAADASPRTRAASAFAWKWLAFEVYPEAPDLADRAEKNSRALGGSPRPLPASGKFQLLARLPGWRLARRLTVAR